jgi:hypothetical protein
MENHQKIIRMDPELRVILEQRGIGEEEILSVIAYTEETQRIFLNRTTEHRLGSRRPSKVTYWVEYASEGDAYRIHSAYSHRMEILEGFNMPPKQKKTIPEWICLPCGVSLELAAIKLKYLDETFAAETPACPSCQRPLVSEADAVEKMAAAEKMLEDK